MWPSLTQRPAQRLSAEARTSSHAAWAHNASARLVARFVSAVKLSSTRSRRPARRRLIRSRFILTEGALPMPNAESMDTKQARRPCSDHVGTCDRGPTADEHRIVSTGESAPALAKARRHRVPPWPQSAERHPRVAVTPPPPPFTGTGSTRPFPPKTGGCPVWRRPPCYPQPCAARQCGGHQNASAESPREEKSTLSALAIRERRSAAAQKARRRVCPIKPTCGLHPAISHRVPVCAWLEEPPTPLTDSCCQ